MCYLNLIDVQRGGFFYSTLLKNEMDYRYIMRLGHLLSYFAYDIPPRAAWVRTAQKMIDTWKGYLNHKEKYRTIADLVL